MSEKLTMTELLLTSILHEAVTIKTEIHHISAMLNLEMLKKYDSDSAMTTAIIHVCDTTLQNLKNIDSAFCPYDEQEKEQETE